MELELCAGAWERVWLSRQLRANGGNAFRVAGKGAGMEYFTLNNGVKLPAVGFGTWDVRGEAGKQVILTALEVGYRLIDTAQMYGNEEIVGQAVRESGLARKDVFITTKLYRPSCSYQKAKEALPNPWKRCKRTILICC